LESLVRHRFTVELVQGIQAFDEGGGQVQSSELRAQSSGFRSYPQISSGSRRKLRIISLSLASRAVDRPG
jgi:hypothetical protein